MIIDEWKIENAKWGIGGTNETNGSRGWRASGGPRNTRNTRRVGRENGLLGLGGLGAFARGPKRASAVGRVFHAKAQRGWRASGSPRRSPRSRRVGRENGLLNLGGLGGFARGP